MCGRETDMNMGGSRGAVISTSAAENMERFHKILRVDKNFDVVYRSMKIGGRQACFYFIDGFVKDEVLQRIIQFLCDLGEENFPKEAHEFSKKCLPYGEIGILREEGEIVTQILMGITCFFIDGYDAALTIDCRHYPARSVEEPGKEKVLRGSRDGFVETLIFNTAMIRRRIRNPELTVEITQAGKSSRTDIAICYMESRVDKELLNKIKTRIENIQVDALTMNQESLAECIYPYKWYNPFPKFKYSERPDTAAAQLLEGNLVILVDTSPAAMILPSSVFDIIEEADDFYFPPLTGTYLRLSRVTIALLGVIVTPIWLLLMQNPRWIPESLRFIVIQDAVNIPLIWQLLILEFSIDGLRLAALNTPSMLTTPLSVIAALVVGEFAANSGWFNSETMLYMAFVALSNYTQSSFELGYALKFMRLQLLILTALFNLWGFVAGMTVFVLAIVTNKTIAGKSYIYPILPFSLKEFKRRFFRTRLRPEEKQ